MNRWNPGVFSSQGKSWGTPMDLYTKLDDEFHFVLDAAASDANHKAPKWYTEDEDALTRSWNMGGAVYCNPPYGIDNAAWCRKAYEESRGGVTVVMLLPVRTDTAWFHDWVWHKADIRFIRGRLKYTDDNGEGKNNAPFPSMVVIYYGHAQSE